MFTEGFTVRTKFHQTTDDGLTSGERNYVVLILAQLNTDFLSL